jgi:RND family efflux transporter MFP subunit
MTAARHWAPFLLLTLAACGASQSPPTTTPSVLVTTQPLSRGALPDAVVAYGNTGPALNGSQTLSVAQPGQVKRLSTTPGAAVRAGQPLVTFVTAPASRNSYQQALVALSAAQKQHDATAQLMAQQLATHDQLLQADKALKDAEAVLAALRADGADQAEHTLSAPFDGVVTAVSVSQGDRTPAGAPLVTVAQANQLVVTVGVDPADQPRLRLGQPAMLERLTGGAGLNGSVVRVDSALNAKTRLVDVDLSFPTGALLPGEAMRASITVGQVTGWVVPHRAVVTASGPPRVFQAVSGKAKAVPVTISLSSSGGDVVQGQMDPARPLIVDGAYQVSDGDAVRSGG